MQSFFVTRSRPQPFGNYGRKEEQKPCSLEWAVGVVNKASLKVQDIRLKLDLTKVVQFMQQKPRIERTREQLVTFCQSPASQSQSQLQYSEVSNDKQGRINTGQSELNINMSQSALSQEFSSSFLTTQGQNNNNQKRILQSRLMVEDTSIVDNKQNVNGEPMQKLRWRNVVTKNILDDSDKQAQCYRQLNSTIQKLTEQNKTLKQCITDILHQLNEKELISVEGDIEALSTRSIEECCRMIEENQILDKITNFDSMMKEFQSTIQVCEQLKGQLQAKIGQCKKYQALLCIKEQGISSLKIVQKNLQKRIAVLTSQRASLTLTQRPFFSEQKDAAETAD